MIKLPPRLYSVDWSLNRFGGSTHSCEVLYLRQLFWLLEPRVACQIYSRYGLITRKRVMAINHLSALARCNKNICWTLLVADNCAGSSAVVKRGSLLSKENLLLLKKRRKNLVDIANYTSKALCLQQHVAFPWKAHCQIFLFIALTRAGNCNRSA
jgi:hypothetical protein